MSDFEALWPGGPVFRQAAHVRLGTDTVLLADFVKPEGRLRGIDLGCASGALLLLLLARAPRLHMTGIELDPEAAERARENLAVNGLDTRGEIVCGDLRGHRTLFAAGSFDLVAANPPYYPAGSGLVSSDPKRAAARGELTCTLGDLCAAAAFLCRTGGSVCLVHKPERLSELFCALTAAGIEVSMTEPPAKPDGETFPGTFHEDMQEGGEGITYCLEGCVVTTTGPIVGFQEGIIDMCGVGAQYTPFSKTLNLCMVCEPVDDVEKHEYERAVRMAGLKVATYIGELARELTPDEVETYETPDIAEGMKLYPDLPRVAYVQMLQSQGLLHDTYVYGVDAKQSLTTMIYPTETMDGAIISGNCVSACDKNTTYHHLNNPVIEDLYARHGKDLNFVGVIITNENVYLADKERSSDWSAKLCEYLGLDGAIISQEGFGNPDADLVMNCWKCVMRNSVYRCRLTRCRWTVW